MFGKSSRKGIMAFNVLVMMPRIIFLVIMLICCVVLLTLFLNNKFDITETQAEVFIDGMLYGTGGVSYFDPLTGRIYPEIVDVNQLNESELNDGLFFPANNIMAARISVGKGSMLIGDPALFRVVYYNKEWYDNWEPLMNIGIPGIGGIKKTEKNFPILLRDSNGRLVSGEIHFNIAQPRSARRG
ncbi:hypothetical protein KY359_00395 [Candidatus Woesearchaeota archaeon]|nr:hypothetical protein [Candidatus Woesearchaeota archaeon]